MKTFFLILTAPFSIVLFGLFCLVGLSPLLAAVLALALYAGFLYSELREFI